MATRADLAVRPYASQDYERLLALLRDVWSHKHDIEQHVQGRWWWQWPEPPLFVVDDPDTGVLAGLCAYLPFALRANGVELTSAWFVDFYVRQDYQGMGLGKRLTLAVQAKHDVTASLSQTAMAYRVFQKLGWSERSAVTLLMHPLPRGWMFRSPAGHRTVAATLGSSLAVWPEVDALWVRVRDAFPCAAVRTSARLLARFAAQRESQYSLVCAYHDGTLAGYMIVRVAEGSSDGATASQGLIVDYLTHPDDVDAFEALLSGAGSALAARGVRRIYALSTMPGHLRALRARGFLAPSTPLVGRWMTSNTKWLTYIAKPDLSSLLAAPWYLTLGDCDLDYAWVRS